MVNKLPQREEMLETKWLLEPARKNITRTV